MATEYWPFLVAANRRLDYRAVLCPDFIEKCGREQILRKNTGEVKDDEYEGKLQFVQARDPQIGPFGIFFKETAAQVDGSLAHDGGGRRVRRIAGLVIRGVVDRQQFRSAEAEKLLDETESEFQTRFEEFWNAEASAEVKTSAGRISGQKPDVTRNQDDQTKGVHVGSNGPDGSPTATNTKPSATPPKDTRTVGGQTGTNQGARNGTLQVACVLFALSLGVCAASAYEYFSLSREMRDVLAKMGKPASLQSELQPLRSRIETIESRLLALEHAKTDDAR